MNTLFDRLIEPDIVDYNALDTLDFDWFKSNGNILDETFADKLALFYDIYAERGIKPCLFLSLTYNTIANERKFRFMLVRVNGDTVFAPYKVIQILKTKQIRFIYKPVSQLQNFDNENAVFEMLDKLPFTKFVTTDKNTDSEPLVEYNDYYYTLDDKDSKYGSSKYRSKNYINRLLDNKDIDVKFNHTIHPDIKRIYELYNLWKNGAEQNGSNITQHSDRLFRDIITSNNDNLYFITIYYKFVPISLQVFMCEPERKYCDCLYIHHIWDGDNDEILQRVLNNVVEIQKWLSWYYLYHENHISNTVYLAGCLPSEHRLLKHKERVTDGKIEHFLLNKKS